MASFKELFTESKTIKVDISDLQDTFSDGPEQEDDDFFYFIKQLEQYGMKRKEWSYLDNSTIEIPSKYKKQIKQWSVQITESIPVKNKNGDCYQKALNYFNSHDCTLVHGLVDGQGALEGITYNHAWCEKGGKIIDMTLSPTVQKSLPMEIYYAIGNIKTTFKYNKKEAQKKMLEYGTYGPWEKKLLDNKY